MSEFENHNMDTSQINTNGYRWEARNRPGRRLASPLCLACNEIDRLRSRLERAEWLLRGSLKFVLDPNLVRTVSVNHWGTRDDMANKIDAFLRGENYD